MIMRAIEALMAIAACNTAENVLSKNFPACIIPQGLIELDGDFAKQVGFISS